MKLKIITMIVLCFVTFVAFAQTEEIVVTATKRVSDGYNNLPAVTIKKPADFLVQEVELVNDSRSPDLRRKEIIATIEGMLSRAAANKSIALSYGKGFLLPVELTDDSLEIVEVKGRSDTASIRIFVKVTLAAGESTKAKIVDIRNFISHTKAVGRTELEPVGDVGLSIVNPEKYRYELWAKISEENKRLIKAIGSECRVTFSEMGARVHWQRSELAELTLYIPYSAQATDCTHEP